MWGKTLKTSSLLSEAQSDLVSEISWGALQYLRSLRPKTVQLIVSVWYPTRSAAWPSGAFPGPRGGEADVSLALPRWCVMRDQEPASSGPWSGSAYWTQVSKPVLLRASPVRPCIPGPAKRRLGKARKWRNRPGPSASSSRVCWGITGHVKDSINESREVLSGMLNTHKYLLESGVEIQKRLESHPASKQMGIFRRPRSASLGDTPKKLTKGKKRKESFYSSPGWHS